MAFVALEESSSRHLIVESDIAGPAAGDTVSGVPVVDGWVLAKGEASRSGRRAQQNLRRTDPEDSVAANPRGKVQIVGPVFDPHVSLANSVLPLHTGQLVKAVIQRKKHYMSTTYEFYIHFADGPRLAFTAKASLRKDSFQISHSGHDRGKLRRRAPGNYSFHDENCEQNVEARAMTFAHEAPIEMDLRLGSTGVGEEHRLSSRKAKWNDKLGAYVLDFQSLCDTASCKNVQLCPFDGPQTLANTRFVLGRQASGSFHVYFRQPFSCLQAFATSLTIFAASS